MSTETTLIQDSQRMNFFKKFNDNPVLFSIVEMNLYQLADQQIEGYNGGLWKFHYSEEFDVPWFELNEEQIHVQVAGNWFDKEVSSEVGSMALSSIIYNRFCWHYYEKQNETLSKLFAHYFQRLSDLAGARLDAGQKEYIEFFNIID